MISIHVYIEEKVYTYTLLGKSCDMVFINSQATNWNFMIHKKMIVKKNLPKKEKRRSTPVKQHRQRDMDARQNSDHAQK